MSRHAYLRLRLLTLLIALAACNLPSQAMQGTPATTPSPRPTSGANVEPASEQPALPTPTPDIPGFEQNLRQALSAEDYRTLETLMGAAFAMQYAGGEGGLIAVSDAIQLLRDSLLSASEPITFDDTAAPETLVEGELRAPGVEIASAMLSRGWGADGNDHALVLVSLNSEGSPYFSGLIYSRGGFVQAHATAEPTDEDQPTAEAQAPTPEPAPRGEIIYETDFRIGWALFDEQNVKSEHSSEGYRIEVLGNWAGWSYSTQIDESNFYAEITAEPLQCPERQGSYGMVFHYQDNTHFRFFVVWCDGQFSLVERSEANRAAVLHEAALPEGLDPSSGKHRLGLLAQGDILAMYVDDIRIGAVGVSAMAAGDIGPYVEIMSAQTINVMFSSLVVYAPAP